MMHDSDSQNMRMRQSSSDFVSALDGAIRQNPIPAALVGVGILWLFTGGRNVMLGGASQAVANGIGRGAHDAGGAAYRGARTATGRVADGMHALADAATEIGAQATGAVRSAADTIGGAVDRTGEIVASAASQAAASWSRDGHDASDRPQSNEPLGGTAGSIRGAQEALADLFARQPLMLGAVGVAIGAAIAASLPISESENRLMGDTADAVKDQAGKLWDETKRRGADLTSRSLEEVEAHGLTPDAAAKAARTVAKRVAGFAEKAGAEIVDRTRR
jgi:hypothetical protein